MWALAPEGIRFLPRFLEKRSDPRNPSRRMVVHDSPTFGEAAQHQREQSCPGLAAGRLEAPSAADQSRRFAERFEAYVAEVEMAHLGCRFSCSAADNVPASASSPRFRLHRRRMSALRSSSIRSYSLPGLPGSRLPPGCPATAGRPSPLLWFPVQDFARWQPRTTMPSRTTALAAGIPPRLLERTHSVESERMR